jgi:hypothetical protein
MGLSVGWGTLSTAEAQDALGTHHAVLCSLQGTLVVFRGGLVSGGFALRAKAPLHKPQRRSRVASHTCSTHPSWHVRNTTG